MIKLVMQERCENVSEIWGFSVQNIQGYFINLRQNATFYELFVPKHM